MKVLNLSLAGIGLATLLAIPGKSHEESSEGVPALRTFEFIQTARVTPPVSGEKIGLWIPLPEAEDPFQTAEILELSSPWPTRISRDSLGNRILHVQADGAATPFTVQVRTRVVRRRSSANLDSKADPSLWLGESSLLVINDEVRNRAASAAPEGTGPLELGRALASQVLESMRYDKPLDRPGWGRGSVEWACAEGFGNCTDFHSLFIALCRSRGIPARFEIGYPVPLDRREGTLKGYHCWATFHVGDKGWIPVDLSEADKNPDRAFEFLETTPPDRVLLSIGRDLTLAPGQAGGPLNMFVHPYLEVDGKPVPESLDHSAAFEKAE